MKLPSALQALQAAEGGPLAVVVQAAGDQARRQGVTRPVPRARIATAANTTACGVVALVARGIRQAAGDHASPGPPG
jgi:hypothetical protein